MNEVAGWKKVYVEELRPKALWISLEQEFLSVTIPVMADHSLPEGVAAAAVQDFPIRCPEHPSESLFGFCLP